MLDDFEYEHDIITFVGLIFMACLGGIVKWFRTSRNAKHKISSFLACFFTAAFVGMQAHFIMTWLNIDMSLQFAVTGAAGYSGGVLIDSLVTFAVEHLKNKIESER